MSKPLHTLEATSDPPAHNQWKFRCQSASDRELDLLHKFAVRCFVADKGTARWEPNLATVRAEMKKRNLVND